jgi:hypothetical protein
MPETERPTPLPTYREILDRYAQAFGALQHDPSPITERTWRAAADLLDAALLMLPGRFPLGQIVATPGALTALETAQHLPAEFLLRHKQGDWGQLDAEDQAANDQALRTGSRLVSSYRTRRDEKLWIITEWDRSVTTLLLPEEY